MPKLPWESRGVLPFPSTSSCHRPSQESGANCPRALHTQQLFSWLGESSGLTDPQVFRITRLVLLLPPTWNSTGFWTPNGNSKHWFYTFWRSLTLETDQTNSVVRSIHILHMESRDALFPWRQLPGWGKISRCNFLLRSILGFTSLRYSSAIFYVLILRDTLPLKFWL